MLQQQKDHIILPCCFGNVGVKQRIKSVFNYKKPSFWIILIAVVASVSLIMVFATNQKETVEPDVLTADESTVYLDEESESEYGYYHCYYSFDLTGSNGIAKKNAKGDISVVIKPDYDLVLVISQNRFIVKRGSYSAMLDSNENEIIPFFRGEIRQINGMSGGKAKPILSVEPLEGTDYFTDTDGNKIIDREFLSTGFTEDGLFFGVTQDAYTFFDITGKVLCTVRDDETAVLSPLGHGFKRLVKGKYTVPLRCAGTGRRRRSCPANTIRWRCRYVTESWHASETGMDWMLPISRVFLTKPVGRSRRTAITALLHFVRIPITESPLSSILTALRRTATPSQSGSSIKTEKKSRMHLIPLTSQITALWQRKKIKRHK